MQLEELRKKALDRGLNPCYITDLISGVFLHEYASELGIPDTFPNDINPVKIVRHILLGRSLRDSIRRVEWEMENNVVTPCYPVLLYTVIDVKPVKCFVNSRESYINRRSDLQKEYDMRCNQYGNEDIVESLREADRRGVPDYNTMMWANIESYSIDVVLDKCYQGDSYGMDYDVLFPCKITDSYVPKVFYRQSDNYYPIDE